MSETSVVALVGAPNSGKTTLYNWLTNSKFKTVNYPGATVEYSLGKLGPQYGVELMVMDTPGTYSLFPKSSDEEVTVKALLQHPQYGVISRVIVVIDGTQLARHLLVAKQIQESGFAMVIAVTMADLLRQHKTELDVPLLEKEFGCPVVLIEGLLGGGTLQLAQAVGKLKPHPGRALSPWDETELNRHLKQIESLAAQAIQGKNSHQAFERTARLDHYLLHPVWGLLVFFAIMFAMFSSIFWLAKPFMDLVGSGFDLAAQAVLGSFSGLWADFLANGLIKGFGSVMVFVPQIFILFFAIGLLESSGYLARAATIIDTPFSKMGMSGRSFVPLLSGFACAVPAIMATRNISNPRDRMITNFIIPIMTCSARLPVYAMLLSLLFINGPPWKAGLALTGLYLSSLLVGAVAASILNRLIAKSGRSIFMMELPMYRRPMLRTLLAACLQKTKSYVFKAGPLIFLFSVVIWVGTSFPRLPERGGDPGASETVTAAAKSAQESEQLQNSYLGRVGQVIEPVFLPMGGDWRTGVGLISAFAARETFVSSVAVLFASGATAEGGEDQLIPTLTQAKTKSGYPLFTVSSVLGLIIFFALAMQCLSTFSIMMRESGSKKLAWIQLISFNVVAYVASVGVVQGLRLLGAA